MSLRAQLDPAIWPAYVSSGLRILRRRVAGPRRFGDRAETICRAIVDACWTGEYFAASAGHFRQAWTRDLGFAAASLVRIGEIERLAASLGWLLDVFARSGRVTTTVFPGGRARDVWTFGVDSLPLLLHGLRLVGAEDLVARHAGLLEGEIERYRATVVDPQTGLVRDDRHFSTHRDTVRTRSNAYANAMLLLLDGILRTTGWFPSPVPPGAAERFVDRFWRGDRFVDRPDRDEVTGDATVVPFFFGVVPEDLGLLAALRAAEAAGLADPLPLRYAARRDRAREDPLQGFFVPDYQGTAIWTSLGAMYLVLLARSDPAAAAPLVAAYRRRIEADGTLWEVFAAEGGELHPYRGRFGLFVADEGMLWAAIFAELFEGSAIGGPDSPAVAAMGSRAERAAGKGGPA